MRRNHSNTYTVPGEHYSNTRINIPGEAAMPPDKKRPSFSTQLAAHGYLRLVTLG